MQFICNSTDLEKYIRKFTPDYMDMMAHLCVIISDLPPNTLADIISGNYLLYYCMAIVKYQAIDKDSKWNKERSLLCSGYELPDTPHIENDFMIYDVEQLQAILNALKKIHWHPATLFKLHYLESLSISEISRQTTIKRDHITKQIKLAFNEIQSILKINKEEIIYI